MFDGGAGGDAVCAVVIELFFAPAIRFVDRHAHAVGDLVGIEDHAAVEVTGRTPGRLRERAVGAEEALFVCVDDGHERDLRQVEALAEEVDADKHVELSAAEVVHDADALERVDVAMDIVAAHVHALEIVR